MFKKNPKNYKSPGSDGFTYEFLKKIWKDIGIRSISEGFKKGELSVTIFWNHGYGTDWLCKYVLPEY